MTSRWSPSPAELTRLWQDDDARQAIRAQDVGEVYRVLQRYGVSQRVIASLTGQRQSDVSGILGGRKVRSVAVLTRIADGLLLPREDFGLATTQAAVAATEKRPARRLGRRVLCDVCRVRVLVKSRLPVPAAPVVDVQRWASASTLVPVYWTGVESRMLRLCRRMSVRDFAAHLGISHRMVSKWEADGGRVQPRPHNQSMLDTSLKLATREEQAMFTGWLSLNLTSMQAPPSTPPRSPSSDVQAASSMSSDRDGRSALYDHHHRPDRADTVVPGPQLAPPSWVHTDTEVITAAPARVVNALFGGHHNFQVDRDLADQMTQIWPGYAPLLWAQKAFANRAVSWLTAQGIHQFLDIGCGLPVIASVHEVCPHARIVYADLDPIVVSLARNVLSDHPHVGVIHGDLRQPASILYADDVVERLDFDQPIAVLLTGVLPHIADADDPAGIIAQIRGAVVSGSYLAMSHLAPVATIRREQEHVRRLYDHTPTPLHLRTPPGIAGLLTGWELVEPGIVPVIDWHPQPDLNPCPPTKTSLLGAVARAV
jgi:transcriptional regulator with XRE-family HTH domain